MRRLAIAGLLGILLSGIFAGASGDVRSTGGAAPIKAEKGQVLVTNRLDVDFAAYKVTFIEIGADRCIPCRKMQPIMKRSRRNSPRTSRSSSTMSGRTPNRAAIMVSSSSRPRSSWIRPGKEVDRHVGFFAKEQLVAVLVKQGAKK